MGVEKQTDGFEETVLSSAVEGQEKSVPVTFGEGGPAVGEAALEYKAAVTGSAVGGVVDSSKDGFEHVIITSVTGVVDQVGDVIEPGSYTKTLAKRRPKQIHGHDWVKPQGKYLWIKELLPGDPELPDKTPQGEPWPKEAGALVGKVRLFNTAEGRDAAERWSVENGYGSDTQFSVGYRATKSRRDTRTGFRHITEMDLFETSEVLWGAMPLSGPMPQAMAAKVLTGVLEEAKAADPEDAAASVLANAEPDNGPAAGQELAEGTEVEGDPEAAPITEPEAKAEKEPTEDELRQMFANSGLDLAKLEQIGEEHAPADDTGKPAESTAAPTGDAAGPDTAPEGSASADGDGGGETKRQFNQAQRDKAADDGAALPDGSFPIRNAGDLANAITAFGRAKDKAAAKAHILKRARALGLTDKLPDDWKTEEKVDLSRFTSFLEQARVLPDLELTGKAAPPAKQGAEKKPKEEPQKSGAAGDFNSKHPRGAAGTSEGGQFVAAGTGTTSSSSKEKAAGDKKPKDAKAKDSEGKKGAKKARKASESQKLREQARETRKAAAAQRKATRAKLKAQLREQRGAELDRRDQVDGALDKEKEAEDSRRDQADAAIEKESDPKKAKAARAAEKAKRTAFAAQFKAKKAAEKAKRKAFAASLRKQRVAQRTSDRAARNSERDRADALEGRADKLEGQGKTAAEDLELKALVAGVEEHPYRPNMSHEACVLCDEFADEPVHTDDDATKAAYTKREDAAWGGDPYPDDVLPGEEADGEPDDGAEAKTGEPGELEAKGGDEKGNAEKLRNYWRTHVAWGKPGDFMECVNGVKKYMTTEQAKGFCAERHHEVTGEWPGKQAHGGKDAGDVETPEAAVAATEEKLVAWSPDAEVGDLAANLEAKIGADLMPGSLEDMRRRLQQVVNQVLNVDERDENGERVRYADIEATFPSFVIAAVHNWRSDEHAYFQVPYGLDSGGALIVGDPVRVQLRVTAIPEEIPEEAEQIALGAAWRIKTLMDTLGENGEVKVGRVLSAVNTTRLRDAVMSLLAVLAAAGVPIDVPSEKQIDEVADGDDEPVVTPDTTSDGAREAKEAQTVAEPAEGSVRMDPAVYQAGLAFLADTVRQ